LPAPERTDRRGGRAGVEPRRNGACQRCGRYGYHAAKPLFEAEWLEPGTHINAAGSNALIRQELSEAAVRRCSVLTVDAVPTALAEAGDLLPLLEKGRLHERQLIELGDVITGRRSGRESPDEITLFESQGMAIQDLAVALRVVQAAEAQGFGTPLPY
jgi:ornithine cyclodeaminase